MGCHLFFYICHVRCAAVVTTVRMSEKFSSHCIFFKKIAPLTGMKIMNINKNYEKVSFIIDIAFVHGGYFL